LCYTIKWVLQEKGGNNVGDKKEDSFFEKINRLKNRSVSHMRHHFEFSPDSARWKNDVRRIYVTKLINTTAFSILNATIIIGAHNNKKDAEHIEKNLKRSKRKFDTLRRMKKVGTFEDDDLTVREQFFSQVVKKYYRLITFVGSSACIIAVIAVLLKRAVIFRFFNRIATTHENNFKLSARSKFSTPDINALHLDSESF